MNYINKSINILTILKGMFYKKYEKLICFMFKAKKKFQSCTFPVFLKCWIHLIYLHLQ